MSSATGTKEKDGGLERSRTAHSLKLVPRIAEPRIVEQRSDSEPEPKMARTLRIGICEKLFSKTEVPKSAPGAEMIPGETMDVAESPAGVPKFERPSMIAIAVAGLLIGFFFGRRKQ